LYYVADFESIFRPHDNDDDVPTLVNTHETAGICLHRMTPHENYQTPPITYLGPNAIEKFLEHIFAESEKINKIMSVQHPLEKVERDAHEMATTCRICKSPFIESNPKCHHYNHVNGDYVFAAYQDCNLKLKPKVCRHGYVLVCLFHNLASYDSAFIFKNFNKKYVERVHKNGTTSFDDVKAILINSEKPYSSKSKTSSSRIHFSF